MDVLHGSIWRRLRSAGSLTVPPGVWMAMLARRCAVTAVLGGMITATLFNNLFVPPFYVILQGFSDWLGRRSGGGTAPDQAAPDQAAKVQA